MKNNLRWTVLAVALLGACGGDDDDSNATGQGGSSTGGSGGTSAGGSGGTSAGGSGGAAGSTSGAGGAAGSTAGQGGSMSGASGQGGSAAGAAGTSAGAAGAAGAAAGAAGAAGGSAGSGQPSMACPGLVAGPTGHLTKQTLKVGALDRTYSIDVPAALDPAKKYPLVFVFHGDGGDGEGIRPGYNFSAIAGNDAIFVYPDATADSGKSFDVSHKAANNIDIAFFDALSASLAQSYCIDPAHVFAAGMSRGGFFANWLGCQRGDKLRAIAPHSGSIYSDEPDVQYTDAGSIACPTPAPAAIVLHGQSDNVVSFDDGKYGLLEWTAGNTCGQTSKPYDPSPCVSYDGCKADHPVVWCAIPGLGHAIWDKGPQATWGFFKSLL